MPRISCRSSRCSVPLRRSPRFHPHIKKTLLVSGEIEREFSPVSNPSFQKSPSGDVLQNRRRSPRFCIENGNLGDKKVPVREAKGTPLVLSQKSRRSSARYLLVNTDTNNVMPSANPQDRTADKGVSSPQHPRLCSRFSASNKDTSTRVPSGVSLDYTVDYGSVFLKNGHRRSSRFLIHCPVEVEDVLRKSDRLAGPVGRNDEGRGEMTCCSSPTKKEEATKVGRCGNYKIPIYREEEPLDTHNFSDTVESTPKGMCEGIPNKLRKMMGEEPCSSSMEWTSDQDRALNKAYLIAKPSPHFWKEISKMVPGKSAKDCFTRVFSKHPTPLARLRRSQMRKINTSPANNRFDSSKPSDFFKLEEDVRKIKRSKNLALKTARHILRKHCFVKQAEQTDMFSLFENSLDSCAEEDAPPPDLKPRRFGNDLPRVPNVVDAEKKQESPEVLKQVKNVTMHEKYIDMLLNRNMKVGFSRGSSNNVKKGGDSKENVIPNDLLVKAAKQALLTEAREVITQFQHTQADLQSTCENFDDGDNDSSASEYGGL